MNVCLWFITADMWLVIEERTQVLILMMAQCDSAQSQEPEAAAARLDPANRYLIIYTRAFPTRQHIFHEKHLFYTSSEWNNVISVRTYSSSSFVLSWLEWSPHQVLQEEVTTTCRPIISRETSSLLEKCYTIDLSDK